MGRAIGVAISERVTAGLVEENRIVSTLHSFPSEDDHANDLLAMPAEQIARVVAEQAASVAGGTDLSAVGIGFPGIIRNGVLEEAPNLQQVKGSNMQLLIQEEFQKLHVTAPVHLFNDADAMAAGLAATRGQLDRTVRVWTLGTGIGYGQYPWSEGVWEGGHMVVSLDPKERFCGCNGQGHLEGIMGERSMRLRFLDLEPEEVFELARQGDSRCATFVGRWHRALSAATASMIHLSGPGKFFITGSNARHVDVTLLNQYLHDMVKMSPLQGYVFEVVPGGDDLAVIGAAVNAARAAA